MDLTTALDRDGQQIPAEAAAGAELVGGLADRHAAAVGDVAEQRQLLLAAPVAAAGAFSPSARTKPCAPLNADGKLDVATGNFQVARLRLTLLKDLSLGASAGRLLLQ